MTNPPIHYRDPSNSISSQHHKKQRGTATQSQKPIVDYGDLLRKTDTELHQMSTTILPSQLNDYGVKSIDGELSLTTTPQVTLSSAFTRRQSDTTTINKSSSLNKLSSRLQFKPTADTSLIPNTHSSLWSTRSNNETKKSLRISDDENSDPNEHDDDSFSCLTDHTSRLDDQPNDFVVPKVNIRSHQRLPSDMDGFLMVDSKKSSKQQVGHLSIIICGDSGIGKSSLIHAFGVVPEIGGHLSTTPNTDNFDQSGEIEDSIVVDGPILDGEKSISGDIKEWYASTQWNNTLSSKQSQKQKQETETWAKNICFVDTPGYGAYVDAKAVIRSTAKYLERQFQLTNEMISPTQPNSPRMARLLHNRQGGHSHVDICLYLILDRVKPVDIEYLRSIHHLCNVIPVITKADLLSRDQEYQLKCKVLQELKDNGIEIYQCGHTFEQLLELYRQGTPDAPPFAISTIGATSTTTQSRQHQLYSAASYSKLIHLKDALFYVHVDQLRQSTVTKFLAWRRNQTGIQQYARKLTLASSSNNNNNNTTTTTSSSSFTTTASSQSTTFSTKAKPITMMIDLDTMANKLATREIAERIQELTLKQKRTIQLHLANYVSEQRQRLEYQKNEQLVQLTQAYQAMEQQDRIKFLTGELNSVLSDLGLLATGSPGLDFHVGPDTSHLYGYLRTIKIGNRDVFFFDPPWLSFLLAALPVVCVSFAWYSYEYNHLGHVEL